VSEEELIGARVLLKGDHPWAGHSGTVVRFGNTILGRYPVVRLDDRDDVPYGRECFVMKAEHAVRL
jgi:hypothetical protein